MRKYIERKKKKVLQTINQPHAVCNSLVELRQADVPAHADEERSAELSCIVVVDALLHSHDACVGLVRFGHFVHALVGCVHVKSITKKKK